MRFVLVSLAVLFVPIARADDAADARAIVEKGVTARGDKPDAKALAQTWKEKGVFTAGGMKMEYTSDWAFQGPDKYRFVVLGKLGDLDVNLTVVANGAKAWGTFAGMTDEFTGEKLEYTLNEVYQLWVTSLTPLLAEKGFTLATAKAKDVGGKPTVAVTVTRDKKPAVTLYFDKASGLLVKTEMTVKDEFQKWKEVADETYFEDYKDADGRQVFTKFRVVRDGKPLITSTLSDQKAAETLDAKLFEKP